ncbi:unnamed protein product [Brassicogethes aeneus]|uniref:Uncharacterized protein n=1 Tax=Brassicogethes aeneus TaxID=1431903 RepID=A0A9P0FEL6_BRAAE|nr:unnamed protein product [Brassicogethes aeneus]
MNLIFIFMIATFSAISAQYTRQKERDDGSFTIGQNYNTRGQPHDSIYALLSKSSGWTGVSRMLEEEFNEVQPRQSFQGTAFISKLPYSEILRALEAFIRLKGEIGSRLSALYLDNREIIRAVGQTLIGKLGLLHGFTLNGIILLRKLLEFAGQLFGNWNVNVDLSNN